MEVAVDDVLNAIGRNISLISRQISHGEFDLDSFEGILRSCYTNLDRISANLRQKQKEDVKSAIDQMWIAVREYSEASEDAVSDHERPAEEVNRGVGRPSVDIDMEQINCMLSKGYSATQIAKHFGCSTKTVYNRLKQNGNHVRNKYSQMSDETLDEHVRELHESHPLAGGEMISGYLRARGLIVQRQRVRDSLTRVDPASAAHRWSAAISRRVYKVPVPNSLWHMDGHMRLSRWGLSTHGCIDGYSRMIPFLACSNNNRSETVLKLFVEAAMKYGLSSRVRTDHGGENLQVAVFLNLMRAHRGNSSHITGPSVHNQRIERLWKDVHKEVIEKYYEKFYDLEASGELDISNPVHITALQISYLTQINKDLKEFRDGWNSHRMRSEGNRTPDQIWMDGMLQNQNSNHTSVRELHSHLPIEENLATMLQEFGISVDDLSTGAIDEEPLVEMRQGVTIDDDRRLQLESELQRLQDPQAKFTHCVAFLTSIQ